MEVVDDVLRKSVEILLQIKAISVKSMEVVDDVLRKSVEILPQIKAISVKSMEVVDDVHTVLLGPIHEVDL
jgi:hypothetical protein